MTDMSIIESQYDFTDLHQGMQHYVDQDLFAGISSAVLVGQDLVDVHLAGMSDREAEIPLRTDHIFRIFSNTKLITSLSVLLLMEEGLLALDDPIEKFIPELGNRRVLLADAKSEKDTEPTKSSITIRNLMSHTAGLSYGLFDPGTLINRLYVEKKVMSSRTTLAEMITALSEIPLTYHPGTSWEYSIATDVLGRLIEVISGQRLDLFFKTRIFDPLDMNDTGFICPEDKLDRLTAYYQGADIMRPAKPGLTRVDELPYRGAYIEPSARLSGGGGLVSTLEDMIALIRSLVPGGMDLLQPETRALLGQNQLPAGKNIQFAGMGAIPGRGYGLVGSVVVEPTAKDPEGVAGEIWWGGVAGTQWWISPETNSAGLLMTQRVMAFTHPFALDLKRRVYRALAS
ncbi:serine hydrolase domain-containing protein [Sneathiella limimaris]|uniref:serine hydrolase domain-containing protein n=1 Tax=Sneathiella limimaris TaxID=1964213 RepID=UPI0019D05D2A|nr:serine hydrolase domain-containing protein [Sneathiella limimaris]